MFKQTLTIILFFLGLVTFVSLGVWQLQRLEWKQGVLDDIRAEIAGEPIAMPEDPTEAEDRYQPVDMTGVIEAQELHVLVSTRDFGAGFRIIAPFTLDDGRRILLDRGYVVNELKDAERSTGPARVTGNLHWPSERDSFTPEDDPEGNWWYARDVVKMAGALGTEPVLVIARSETDPQILPLPVTTEGIPNDHLEYAMTWFLFALVWVTMTGFALWRIRRNAGATTQPG